MSDTKTTATEISGRLAGLMPRLVVDGADAALEFYATALGATVSDRHTDDEGHVVHSLVTAGPVTFAVRDAGYGDPAPSREGVPVLLSLDVTDADAVAERMLAGGAEVIYELADRGYGYGGRLRDPFGHQWMISQVS